MSHLENRVSVSPGRSGIVLFPEPGMSPFAVANQFLGLRREQGAGELFSPQRRRILADLDLELGVERLHRAR